MKRRNLALPALLALLCPPPSGAAPNFTTVGRKGTVAADFLEMGVGARGIAMGEAFSAVGFR